MEKNVIIGILYEYYGELLTSKQSEAIEQYYLEDLSLTEIALMQGVSKQNISETIKRSEKALIEFEDKLGLYSKALNFQKLVEELDKNLKVDLGKEKYNNYKALIDRMIKKLN